jgi:hypothetical protein
LLHGRNFVRIAQPAPIARICISRITRTEQRDRENLSKVFQIRGMPQHCGKRRPGARKASEIVMLTLRQNVNFAAPNNARLPNACRRSMSMTK